MTIEKLEELMIEHNLSIRAIPKMVREVYDVNESIKKRYPDGVVMHLAEFKREMYVRYVVPKNSGKFICVKNRGTLSTVNFSQVDSFDTIDEAVENFLKNNLKN